MKKLLVRIMLVMTLMVPTAAITAPYYAYSHAWCPNLELATHVMNGMKSNYASVSTLFSDSGKGCIAIPYRVKFYLDKRIETFVDSDGDLTEMWLTKEKVYIYLPADRNKSI